MPFGFFDGIFGNGGAGQAQARPGEQAQAQAIGGQAGAQEAMQNAAGLMGQAAMIQPRNYHNYVIENIGGYNAYVEPIRMQQPRPRHVDWQAAIHNMANSWMMEGLDFKEIVVSKATMLKLHQRFIIQARYVDMRIEPEPPPKELIFATAMGMIKFICEDDKPKGFNLDKYMETVE